MFGNDWKEVFTKAWSMKLMGFAAFLETAQELVPYMAEFIPWWASILVILAGMAARLMKQSNMEMGE